MINPKDLTGENIIIASSSIIEIANVVAFFLSDAIKTIIGTSILVDGAYYKANRLEIA